MKSMIFGQMLHKVIKLAEENNEIPLISNWIDGGVNRLAGDKEEIMRLIKGKEWDFLTGTIDDLVYVKGEPIICDKKTTGSIDYFKKFGKPSDSHKEQINMYRVLLKKCLNIDAKWGANIYISNCITPDDKSRDAPIIIPYRLDEVEKTEKIMIERCKKIKDYMEKKIIPDGTKNYLCDGMCNYASRCFNETKKKFD